MDFLFKNIEAGILLISFIFGIILTSIGFTIRPGKVSRVFLALGTLSMSIAAVCFYIIWHTNYVN